MLTSTELQLNRIAQGCVSHAEGCAWFDAQLPDDRASIFGVLVRLCHQSHPIQQDVWKAIAYAGLKTTFTPCVLLTNASQPERTLYRLLELPATEQLKSFKLLLALFKIADTRRRQTQCKDGCSHKWHNLSVLYPI